MFPSNSNNPFGLSDPFAATPSHLQYSTDLSHLPATSSASTSSITSSPFPSFMSTPLDNNVFRSLDVLPAAAPAFDLSMPHLSRPAAWSAWNAEPTQTYSKKLDFSTSDSTLYEHLPQVLVTPAPKPSLVIPSLPPYIERYSTFLSYTLPEQILSSLLAACVAHRIDYEHEQGKNKIKCVGYHDSACTQFNIYVYSGAQPNSYAVEFQRRHGCIMTFHTLYSRMLKSLGSVVIKPYEEVSSAEYDMDSLPVPTLDGNSLTLDATAIDVLCHMVTSPDIKATREGMSLLANSSVNMEVLKQKECTLINAVVYALTSGDEESARCAALFIYKLCTLATLSQANISSLVKNAIELFDSTTLNKAKSLYMYDTKRQLSTALESLSASNPSEFATYSDVLMRHHTDSDLAVQNSIQHTLHNIGITC